MSECALCGEKKLPEGETIKGKFRCICGREWILEKRKVPRLSHWRTSESNRYRFDFIFDCLSLFNSTLDGNKLIRDFSELVFRKMDYKNIGILLIDLDRSKIELASYKSKNPRLLRLLKKIDLDYDLSVGVLVKSMAETKSVFYNIDSQEHPFYRYYKSLTNTHSQLIIPILYGNTPMGILTIDYPDENVHELSEEREILELITGQFAVALRNSFLYERSKRQSQHFQNLHLSALTLSKLYLDNHEEMMKMILLAASSFVDSQWNYIYEYNHARETNHEYNVYRLLKDQESGYIQTDVYRESGWEQRKKNLPQNGYFDNRLCVRFSSEDNTQYILELVQENGNFTRDDFEVINAFVALSKITIDNTILYESLSRKKIFEREIEIAREIQLNLLPKKFPEFPGYTFAGIMEAARGVGGDYYDFVVSPDRAEVVICIGDVSGKGVGAGMVMATVRTILHSLVRRKPSNKELLQDINTYLYYNYKDSPTPRFMTMTLLSWKPDCHSFNFAGAGHGSIYHYQASSGAILEIETNGILLGISQSVESMIHESTLFLDKGDSILLYTDGITEAMNPKGELFGEQNLINSYKNADHSSSSAILDSILRDVKAFIGTREQHDDLTMICIHRK